MVNTEDETEEEEARQEGRRRINDGEGIEDEEWEGIREMYMQWCTSEGERNVQESQTEEEVILINTEDETEEEMEEVVKLEEEEDRQQKKTSKRKGRGRCMREEGIIKAKGEVIRQWREGWWRIVHEKNKEGVRIKAGRGLVNGG